MSFLKKLSVFFAILGFIVDILTLVSILGVTELNVSPPIIRVTSPVDFSLSMSDIGANSDFRAVTLIILLYAFIVGWFYFHGRLLCAPCISVLIVFPVFCLWLRIFVVLVNLIVTMLLILWGFQLELVILARDDFRPWVGRSLSDLEKPLLLYSLNFLCGFLFVDQSLCDNKLVSYSRLSSDLLFGQYVNVSFLLGSSRI
jgi:hypothetical protein